jgi:predicted Zn-ribbon and HTH transcriptional regulator
MENLRPVTCHNCRFDVSGIELSKIHNKCPRCGCGQFNNVKRELRVKVINQPETGDQNPLITGKPLVS